MKVIVDGMGGDNAPFEIVKGTVDAVKEYGIEAIIVGREEDIRNELNKYEYSKEKIQILNAENVITNDDDPTMAIRRNKDSSLVVGLNALKDGLGDGFVSAGSTGALLAGGTLIIKRIKGIDRAAITSVYPTLKGTALLVDAGANADCKPEYLNQFALMGSIYMEKVLKKKNPKVGLVNIGSEEGKGNQLVKEAYDLLKKEDINFIGNIEGRDIPAGKADIIVCDGFVGNVILKLTEGMASSIFSILKDTFMASAKSKIGASLLKDELVSLKKSMDYREFGGAPLLGTRLPVFKAHGSSDAYAFKNAIHQLIPFVEEDVVSTIEENMKESIKNTNN